MKDKQPGMTPFMKTKSFFYLICNTNKDYTKEQDYARLCLDDIIVNNLASDPFQEMGSVIRKLPEKCERQEMERNQQRLRKKGFKEI